MNLGFGWHWPWLRTPESAAHFWGWAQILLAVLNFLVLGMFFAFDTVPYLLSRKRRPAIFGLAVVAISLTSGVHALIRGVYTLNMQLTPTGPKPLDIASLIFCFGPLLVFGSQRLRILRGKPERVVHGNPAWLVLLVAAVGAYTGAFVTRFIDTVRFKHAEVHWLRFDSNLNLLLWLLYLGIALTWLRFQVRLRRSGGTWNVLGMSIGLTFATMSFHRLAQSIEIAAGAYRIHDSYQDLFLWIDVASVIAAVIFLGVAVSLLGRSGGPGQAPVSGESSAEHAE